MATSGQLKPWAPSTTTVAQVTASSSEPWHPAVPAKCATRGVYGAWTDDVDVISFHASTPVASE